MKSHVVYTHILLTNSFIDGHLGWLQNAAIVTSHVSTWKCQYPCGIGSSGTRVMDEGEPPWDCWESNQVLSTTELSFVKTTERCFIKWLSLGFCFLMIRLLFGWRWQSTTLHHVRSKTLTCPIAAGGGFKLSHLPEGVLARFSWDLISLAALPIPSILSSLKESLGVDSIFLRGQWDWFCALVWWKRLRFIARMLPELPRATFSPHPSLRLSSSSFLSFEYFLTFWHSRYFVLFLFIPCWSHCQPFLQRVHPTF